MTTMAPTEAISLADMFSRLEATWRPRIVSEVNDMALKVVKLEGEFLWHQHEGSDELFLSLPAP